MTSRDSFAKVSFVIPTWNAMSHGKSLSRTLASIAAQKLDTTEVLIVDNLSTDGTAAVGHEFGASVIERSCSRSEARNLGSAKSDGEFVVFLDSDHELEPGAVHAAIALADSAKLDAVFFKTRYLNEHPGGKVTESLLNHEIRIRGGHMIPNFYRKRSIEGILFPPNVDLGEDFLFFQAFARRNPRIGSLDWGLLHYAPPDIPFAWKRSYTYGGLYRRGEKSMRKSGFFSGLTISKSSSAAGLWHEAQKSLAATLSVTFFMAVKSIAFAAGYLGATVAKKPHRTEPVLNSSGP